MDQNPVDLWNEHTGGAPLPSSPFYPGRTSFAPDYRSEKTAPNLDFVAKTAAQRREDFETTVDAINAELDDLEEGFATERYAHVRDLLASLPRP
jgi:hypothetical protein